jgi:chromosome segregation ATPase
MSTPLDRAETAGDPQAAHDASELQRVNGDQHALDDPLGQSRSELATSRSGEEQLAQQMPQRETELHQAEERVADAITRLNRLQADLERVRSDNGSRADELERRDAALVVRSAELDTREASVADAEQNIRLRSAQIGAHEAGLRFRSAGLDTREAELELRSAQLDTRDADLRLRSAQLDGRAAELELRSTQLDPPEASAASAEAAFEALPPTPGDIDQRTEAVERREEAVWRREHELDQRTSALDRMARRLDEPNRPSPYVGDRRPRRSDVHLAVAPDHGYKLVVREGAPPAPGTIVEVDDVRYRCLRVQASPFLGDNRPLAVLELLPTASPQPEPARSAATPIG